MITFKKSIQFIASKAIFPKMGPYCRAVIEKFWFNIKWLLFIVIIDFKSNYLKIIII